MNRSMSLRALLIVSPLLFCAGVAAAQIPPLTLPEASPEARVSQTIGLTKMTISYHRPGVNKRKIWGDLVPYNDVWRAGANENTTISFSSPVTVESQKLPAGTYGLHMIPTEKDWTIIFSNVSSAWGSFSYDKKEDAARISVIPKPADFVERLSYTLEEPTEDSVHAVLRWERLAVPFRIHVDISAVIENLRSQLRGLPRFSWQGWNQAAAYCLRNGTNLEEAMQWADRSISMNENFTNLRTKAGLIEKQGDSQAAEQLRAKAFTIAAESDINAFGYQLLGQNKADEAIAIFRKNVKDHPQSWNVYDSLAEAYERKGDSKLAIENYRKALSMTRDETQKKRISGTLKKLGAS